MPRSSIASCLFALVVLIATGSVAFAQPPASSGDPEPERPPRAAPAETKDGIIQLEELVVEGEIEKPNAFYILHRARFEYEVLDLRTSFLPDVVDSVQGDPF